MLVRKLSEAYWPNHGANESANRTSGDAAVDKLTIGELAQFYQEVQSGPTYCMVTQRVQELLKQFPPHIEDKKNRMASAVDAAKASLAALSSIRFD